MSTINQPVDLAESQNLSETELRTFASGAGFALVGKFLGRGIHILGQIIVARLLSPAIYGLYGLGWTILSILTIIAPLGLDKGVIRFSIDYLFEDRSVVKGVILQSIVSSFLAGSLIGASVYFSAPWLASFFGKPDLVLIIKYFALVTPFATTLRVAASSTRITKRVYYFIFSETLSQPAVFFLVIIVSYIAGWHLMGALGAALVSFIMGFLVSLYFVAITVRGFIPSETKARFITKELFAFSIPASFAGIFLLLLYWVDRLVVGYFRSEAELGIYQAVSQFSILFAIILSGFDTIFAPHIADLYRKKEITQLQELFRISTKWGLYISLPIFMIIVSVPKELLQIIFGADYIGGWASLIILSVGQLINVSTGAVGFIFVMTGNQNRWLISSCCLFIVSIVLNVILVPRWGINGAATGTAIALSGLFIVGLIQIKQILGITPYDKRYLKGIFAALITFSVILGERALLVNNPMLNLIIITITAFGLSGLLLLIFGLNEEDLYLLRILKQRFQKKDNVG